MLSSRSVAVLGGRAVARVASRGPRWASTAGLRSSGTHAARLARTTQAGAPAVALRRSVSTAKSWVPQEEEDLQLVTRKALVYELTQAQSRVAEGLVTWFTSQMPASYFRQVCQSSASLVA